MAVTSGFFNSVDGDRLYEAEAFNQLFDGLLTDGVIPAVGDSLMVVAGTGMDVVVGAGRAWFNRSWIDNNADLVVSLSSASPGFPRWDIIALDMNKTDGVRENSIVLLTGVATSSPEPPTLIDVEDHKQYPLAHILVPAAASEIFNQDITNMVGTNDTPFATGILQQVSVEDLLIQWDAEFQDWFINLQNQLDENQVTNLQGQINDLAAEDVVQQGIDTSLQSQVDDLVAEDLSIRELPRVGRNIVINGGMTVSQRTGSVVPVSGHGYHPMTPDRFRLLMVDAGTVTPNTLVTSSAEWYNVVVNTTKVTPSAGTYLRIVQSIEGNRLQELQYGTAQARPSVLSFLAWSSLSGTYCVTIYNLTSSRMVSYDYTLVGGVAKIVTIVIPPDTNSLGSVPNDANEGFRIDFFLSAGSNHTSGGSLMPTWGGLQYNRSAIGQVNLVGTAGADFRLSRVQLEVGSVATLFERLPAHEVLQQCQRYYEARTAVPTLAIGHTYDSGAGTIPSVAIETITYASRKRITPTLSGMVVAEKGGSPTYTPIHVELNNKDQLRFRGQAGSPNNGTLYQAEYSFIADAEL